MDAKNSKLSKLIKKPITVGPNTTLMKTREILLENKIKRIIVVDKRNPIGVITEKDIAKKTILPQSYSRTNVDNELFTPMEGWSFYECSLFDVY